MTTINTHPPRALPSLKCADGQVSGFLQRVDELDGFTAADELSAAQTLINKLEAAKLALVDRVERCGIWQSDANSSMTSWLRVHANTDHKAARADVVTARALRELPALAAAASEGRVCRGDVDAIVSIGRANPARAQLLPHFESAFTQLATTQTSSTLIQVLRAWADQVDPMATIKDEAAAHARRYLHLTQVADGWMLQAFLTSEQGAKVAAVLNAALAQAWQPKVRATNTGTDQAPQQDEAALNAAVLRSTEKDKADAFVDGVIAAAAASGALPECGGVKPTLIVTVPMARLEQPCHEPTPADRLPDQTPVPDAESGQGSGGGQDSEGEPDRLPFIDNVASLATSNGPGQGLISAQGAARIACDCNVHRIVLNPAGVPIDVGRATRSVTSAQRKALVIRDKGCTFPNCDRPAAWCDAHHIVHWANGGKSDLTNYVLLCSRHHHDVHTYGHKITMTPQGRPRYTLNSRARPVPTP